MNPTALFIIHQAKPGQREAVKAVWMRDMAPDIQGNPGHLAYFYTFDNDNPDAICAFQVYESAQTATDFLQHPSYQAYLAESRDLLEHAPKVMSLSPQWAKAS